MQKVLFVFNHPAPYKVTLLNRLAAGIDLHVIFERKAARDRPALFYGKQNYAFTFHKIKGLSFGKENFLSWGIIHHLEKHQYDRIVINGYSTLAEMITLHYLKKHHLAYDFYINGGVVKKESQFKHKIKTYFIKGAQHYYAPGAVADPYLLNYGITKSQIYHYPYATISNEQIIKNKPSPEEKEQWREENHLPGDYVIVSFGAFNYRKNNQELIEAFLNLPKNYTLLLIGSGPEEKKYRRIIARRKLSNVIIHPFMPHGELIPFIAFADRAVFLSREDIYGHMVNEALAAGLPVIASTAISSARQLIESGNNGYLVNINNPHEVVQSILAPLSQNYFHICTSTAQQNTLEKMVSTHQKWWIK